MRRCSFSSRSLRSVMSCEDILIEQPDERITAFAIDPHGHDDGEHKLLAIRPCEQAGYLRLTRCESRIRGFRSGHLFQGRAEGRPGMDELLQVTVNENNAAALKQGQRELGLALERGVVAVVAMISPRNPRPVSSGSRPQ
jgi:hypothetical protein